MRLITMSTCLRRWSGLECNRLTVRNASFVVSEHARLARKIITVSLRSIDSESAARNNVGNYESYF